LVYDLADHVGGGGATNSGGGARLPMPTISADVEQHDFDLSFDDEVTVDADEYRRIMGRIRSDEREGMVSAFNSSI
jgi:hypothetical protein